jgi:hypothetical protein
VDKGYDISAVLANEKFLFCHNNLLSFLHSLHSGETIIANAGKNSNEAFVNFYLPSRMRKQNFLIFRVQRPKNVYT